MEVATERANPPEALSQIENQTEEDPMIDLNSPPVDNMMIIPTTDSAKPPTSRALYHMTSFPSWSQTINHSSTRRDIAHTTTIHSYHHIQTHTPIQTDPLRITHLPDHGDTLPFPNHPLPTPYTVENPPDTPPKTTNHENQPMMTGLSPFLNRMTLKCAHTEEDEECQATTRPRPTPREPQPPSKGDL